MTKRKHNSKPDIITRKTKGRTKVKMDIEKIIPERKHKMTPVSRDLSKDTTVSIGDKEVHHAVSRSTDIDLIGTKHDHAKSKKPIPVMYGIDSIPPGPYNHEDTLKYMRYALETASSADSQQIDKLLEILHYLLDNTIYQEV